MNTAWFILLGGLLIGYAILDGIDMGIGMLHLALGKTDGERRTNLNAIGPFWAGYEVWLPAARWSPPSRTCTRSRSAASIWC